VTLTLQALSLVEKAKSVQIRFTLRLRDQWSMWMKDGCKSLHGFLHGIKWIMFHGHLDYLLKTTLLEVGLTYNRETKALRTLTTIGLLYFIMCEDLHESKFIDIAFGRGPNHIWLHTTLEIPWRPYMIWEVCQGRPLDTFFLLDPHNFMVTALDSCVKQCPRRA
jgi:hypothetical protein